MIIEINNMESDQQVITATARSTNTIDLGQNGTPPGEDGAVKGDIGKGYPIPILIQVTEDFATLTSLTVTLETDDNTSFSSAKVLATETILLADLVAGKKTFMQMLPTGANERYLSVNYTVNGSDATAGKIKSGIVMGIQNEY